ncbi:hypothetical protein [Sphingomonas sp. ID0503]|uniref:hypothetical protein n=1 Tax=Sphingomonas sp. ID0503 TaxID=3399691 RepID=UPI003AFAFBAF
MARDGVESGGGRTGGGESGGGALKDKDQVKGKGDFGPRGGQSDITYHGPGGEPDPDKDNPNGVTKS